MSSIHSQSAYTHPFIHFFHATHLLRSLYILGTVYILKSNDLQNAKYPHYQESLFQGQVQVRLPGSLKQALDLSFDCLLRLSACPSTFFYFSVYLVYPWEIIVRVLSLGHQTPAFQSCHKPSTTNKRLNNIKSQGDFRNDGHRGSKWRLYCL